MNKKEKGLEKAEGAENADSRRYEWKRQMQRIRRRKKEVEEQRVLSSVVENLDDSKVSMKTLFNVCLGMTRGCIYSESSRTRSLETTRK